MFTVDEMLTAMNEIYRTEYKTIKKNGQDRDAYVVYPHGNEVGVVFYVDGLQNMTLSQACDYMNDYILNDTSMPNYDKITNILKSWDNIKTHIMPCLSPANMISDEMVSREFYDMRVCYRVVIEVQSDATQTARLTYPILKQLGKTEEDVYNQSMANIKNFYRVMTMGEALGAPIPDGLMWVLSNESKLFGATSILDQDALDEMYDTIGGNFYLLPSSVHELIAVPMALGDPKRLMSIVKEVNSSDVIKDEDFLTNSIFSYDGETHTLIKF